MGTRLWYAMWDANAEDDAAFERRADPVLREIGGRCKVGTVEAGQQPQEPTPAPSPAPTLQAARVSTAVAATVDTSPSFSVQQRENDARVKSSTSSTTSGSFTEMAAFIREERAQFREERAQFREERAQLEAQRQELEAKLGTQRKELQAQLESQRQEWEAKLERQRQSYEAKLETQHQALKLRELQARFEALHASKYLSDDEFYILENLVVDNLSEEFKRARGEGERHSTVISLMRLSDNVASDAGLARQLRRKYV